MQFSLYKFVIIYFVFLRWTSFHSSVTYLSMRLRHLFVRLEILATYPKLFYLSLTVLFSFLSKLHNT